MEREQFLGAQLWLRRVSAADWAALDDSSEQLLPPPATSESATAWCCFHVGARLCVFGDADADATQLRLELRRRRRAPLLLLARFDGRHAFAVDLRAVAAVAAPLELSGASREQQEAPPFGSLELPHVSVRVWMEPQDTTPTAARQMLQHALLGVQQCVVQARQSLLEAEESERSAALEGSWRDVFRHSQCSERPAPLQLTTPAELLQRARRIFKRDADFEAVKMTCWRVVRSSRASPRRRRKNRESDADDAQQPPPNLGDTFSETEFALLLTELAHIFGDNHDSVSELLGFGSGAVCQAHDRCFALRDPERTEGGEPASCVTAKWEAWDEYLEASAQVLTAPKGSTDSPNAKHATLQAATSSFQRAVTDDSDALAWQQHAEMHRKQIRAFERVGFDAFFPSERRQQQQPPAAQQLLQQLKAEQMLAVLLEKRKQLLRDELAFSLLPRRRLPDASASSFSAGSSTSSSHVS